MNPKIITDRIARELMDALKDGTLAKVGIDEVHAVVDADPEALALMRNMERGRVIDAVTRQLVEIAR